MSADLTAEEIREIRDQWDDLAESERQSLMRCFDAQAILNDRTFWKIAASVPDAHRLRIAHLVACFPAAEQLADPTGFKPGAFLREALHPGRDRVEPAEANRYRQLVQARDVDELVPRLKKILGAADRPVDWGVLGRDMLAWSDKVRKVWDRDFFGEPA